MRRGQSGGRRRQCQRGKRQPPRSHLSAAGCVSNGMCVFVMWRERFGNRGGQKVVSEPDPRKIEKEGLVNRLGWKCTLRLVCRRTSDWLLISILMCVY